MKKLMLIALISFSSSLAYSHARLEKPDPRDLNDGNKDGPCGKTAKPAAPKHKFMPGETIPIQIVETIDHPGKYLINFSAANDQNFEQYKLKIVADVQGGQLPHIYDTTVTLPNITCNNCTLQVIQSMEENPDNPSFYYSCADVQLAAATPPPPTPSPAPGPGDVGAQNLEGVKAPGTAEKPGFGGCGLIDSSSSGPQGPTHGLIVILFLLPFMVLAAMRRQAYAFAVKRSRRTWSR